MESVEFLLNQFIPIIAKIDSKIVSEGTFRLDGQYHALFKNGINDLNAESFTTLNDCCIEIYEVPPFKHIYVQNGIPFYTSSGLFENELIPSHYLTSEMPNIEKYRIRKGQILMARSGNVESGILGQIMIVGDILNKTTTSDHVLRFTPNNEVINTGYLATFLMSEFCKGQLLKNASGAVIPAIRPDSLKDLEIPIIENKSQITIGKNVINAVESRESAILKLKLARSLVLKYNNLPDISEIEIETIDPNKETHIRLTNNSEFTDAFRLDAHFYNPIAKRVLENLKMYCAEVISLSDLTTNIIMGKRFKRNYVGSNFGTPFLSGKNIIQIRPSDINHLSDTEIDFIDELLVKKNWTMITCSGTLGRTCFVYNNYENYAASQHILRVVPNEDLIDPGYLYCFLSCDYGYHQLVRYKYGSVIDEIDDKNIASVQIPIPSDEQQKEIGELVRQAYDLRAEAIRLEDEAQEILTQTLTKE